MANKINLSIIKIVIEILEKYEASDKSLAPVEYIRHVMDTENLCLDENSETCTHLLLDIYRFDEFLSKVLNHILYTEDEPYFKVIIYLLLFKLNEKTADDFYKALVEYSQKITKVILKFMIRKCTLPLLTEEATKLFDIDFVKDFIENFKMYIPLLRNMLEETNKYFEALNLSKIKPLTVPITPGCMKHIRKVPRPPPTTPSLMELFRGAAVPRSTYEGDNTQCELEKLKEENRLKGIQLQEDANRLAFNCANYKYKSKSKTFSSSVIQAEPEVPEKKEIGPCDSVRKVSMRGPPPPVKTNLATMLREGARLQKEEDEEMKRIEEMVSGCSDVFQIEYYEAERRRENEEAELLNIKKRHIQGLLTFEEAASAKRKVIEANKVKRQEFDEEKLEFEKRIEEWKKREEEIIRDKVGKVQLASLNAREAVEYMKDEKYQLARDLAEESKQLLVKAMAERKAELDQKIQMIKELRALQAIKEPTVKEIDDTAVSGLGLLTEMSLAELKERLFIMRVETREEVERRQKAVKEKREEQKRFVKETQEKLENYQTRKLITRKLKEGAKAPVSKDVVNDDIVELENKLKEKREIRLKEIIMANKRNKKRY